MSATTSTHPTTPVPGVGATVRRNVASELIKLRSLRSHVVLLAVAAGFVAVLGPVQSFGQVMAGSGAAVDTGTALSLALSGMSGATVLVGVLGVLVVTGEYAPRSIRTTFTLVPRRGHVVLGKAIALGLTTATVGVVTVAVAVTASTAVLAADGSDVGWGSPTVLRAAAGAVWYLVGWAVLGLVAGWVTRSKLGGAALLLGVMWVLAPVLSLVPGRAGEVLVAALPSSVGSAMLGTGPAGDPGRALLGFVLWTAYLVVLTVVSARIVARRDA